MPVGIPTATGYNTLAAAPSFWYKGQVDASFFASQVYPGSRAFDPESIMMVSMPSSFFTDEKSFNLPMALSDSDKKYIATLYP